VVYKHNLLLKFSAKLSKVFKVRLLNQIVDVKMSNLARPFIKWAGGKTQLLGQLTKSLPNFKSYHEAFLGGGALFFNLFNKKILNEAFLYDYNKDLITTYDIVKSSPLLLMEKLNEAIYKNDKETYYKIRGMIPTEPLEIAARFIYLNKTAYNGLYRVNSSGKFNAPFGKYPKVKLFDHKVILADTEALQKTHLFSGDFSQITKYTRKGDLVYFDPPYHPISKTSSFTSYTALAFGEEDQQRLAKIFKELDRKGCYVMLSNSSNKLIKELYSDYYIEEVLANRAINSNPNGRGKIKEFIVRNWPLKQKKLIEEESLQKISN